MSRPYAIIFDWDNTLVDSWGCIQAAMNATLRHMDQPEWSLVETKRRVARSMRDAFPAMFGGRWEEAREVFTSTFESIHLDHLVEMPGAGRLLQTLHAQGVKLSVVSNKRGRFLRKEAEVLGWSPLFDALIGAGDAERDKPDPAPALMAMKKSGISPGPGIWFVGDTAIDLQCAVNTGIVPVLMRTEAPQADELDLPVPQHHVWGCAELASLVEQLKVPISG
jgi:phosphoglycolate phosphatase